jgi:hypothetical protein
MRRRPRISSTVTPVRLETAQTAACALLREFPTLTLPFDCSARRADSRARLCRTAVAARANAITRSASRTVNSTRTSALRADQVVAGLPGIAPASPRQFSVPRSTRSWDSSLSATAGKEFQARLSFLRSPPPDREATWARGRAHAREHSDEPLSAMAALAVFFPSHPPPPHPGFANLSLRSGSLR